MHRITFWISIVALLAAGAGYLLAGKQQSTFVSGDRGVSKTAVASSANLTRTLRITGQTSARVFVNLVAPKQTGPNESNELILVKLVAPGSIVHKGEIVAEIDAQSLKDHVDDIADTIRQANADIVKRRAEQAAEMVAFEQTVRVAKADLEKAKLDAKATPLLTDIERELLKLSVEESDARYTELQKEIPLRQQSNAAELKILQITSERHQRHHDRHEADLTHFTVSAPINGLAVMQTIWRDGDMGQVRKGDRIRPGQLFMKIVDPATMQVEAFANQAESSDLRLGQDVEVRLDAFPDLKLSGHVYSIGALATTSGWRQNYYIRRVPVRIAMDGQDQRLIPDLSASADIRTGVAESSVVVPVAAVHQGKQGPELYVKEGSRFVERAVTLGLSDNVDVAVTSGLRTGEEVRLN